MFKLPALAKLSGGLGNQIYGLCTAWLVSVFTNRKILLVPISIDNPQYSNREFDIFEIDFKDIVENKITERNVGVYAKLLLRALSSAVRRKWIPGEVRFDENFELIPSSIAFYTQNLCDSRLAAKARSLGFPITVDLKNPSAAYESMERETQTTRVLAVHLRLTDIRTFESGNRMLTPHYFARNIKFILDQKSIEEIWVFSDEPAAIPDFLPPDLKMRIVSSTSSLTVCEELVLMSKCAALLGSRSTFSFWAGFWNSNQDSIYYPGPVDGFEQWHDSLL